MAPDLRFEPSLEGLHFRFALEDGRTPPDAFPLDAQGKPYGNRSLRLLERLWYEDRLEEREDSYLLPLHEFYDLESVEREELGLPADETSVDIELRTDGYAGSNSFRIRPIVQVPSVGIVTAENRTGAFLEIDGEMRPVSEAAAELLCELDSGAGDDVRQHLLHIGRVRDLAQPAGAQLDQFLSRQEIEVPEGIAVEAEAVAPNEIRLRPVPVGVEDMDLGTGKTQPSYFDSDGEKKRRLVLTDGQISSSDEVKRRDRIRGRDVPRFLDNPEAFLPDDIDLDLFSLRVKGIVPRKYNSQPYLHLEKDSSRDWFATSVSIDLFEGEMPEPEPPEPRADPQSPGEGEPPPGRGEEEPSPPPDISPEEYADLCRDVLETEDRYVMHQGSWVEINPEHAESYLDAWDHLERDDAGGFRLPRSHSGYTLDVISNVDELEFALGEFDERDFLDEIPEYPTPETFVQTLRQYQQRGYSWLRYLHERDYGGLLADDMGVGKTVQVIALMAHLAEKGKLAPTLLVLPAALIENWHEEIQKFCPSIQHIYHHLGPDRETDPQQIALCEVVLTTYATLRRDQIDLGQVDWKLVACDEAQKVKNPTAQRTSAVKAMKSPLRLALTGTPVENGLSELWCIVDFAQPGKLGSQKEFREEFERPIQEGAETPDQQQKLATRLQEELTPHYLRRVKEDVLDELPERKPDCRIPVGMSDSQARAYSAIRRGVRDGELIPLAALQNLIQVCSHPDLYRGRMLAPDRLVSRCPKLEKTLDVIDEIRGKGEKLLIYTRFRLMQRILQECLKARFDIHAPVLNGEVRTGRRHQRVKRFNKEPGFRAMILSPEAAGVGLNIVGANHVIHYTRLWNPAKENQATDRVYRIGQDRPVQVYYPIVRGEGFKSVEEHLDELLAEKQELAKTVIWPREQLSVSGDMQDWLSESANE